MKDNNKEIIHNIEQTMVNTVIKVYRKTHQFTNIINSLQTNIIKTLKIDINKLIFIRIFNKIKILIAF